MMKKVSLFAIVALWTLLLPCRLSSKVVLESVFSDNMVQTYTVRGCEIEIAFRSAEGLTTSDGKAPAGFWIAGSDHVFHPAEARIEGEKVVVFSPGVEFPVAVRYAWGNNPSCNLVNAAGLPASPFRTDDWLQRAE